jgi:hypothetical protein
MNRKDFLKRLGLLSTVAVTTPILLSSKDDKPKIQPSPSNNPGMIKVEGVERLRITSRGGVIWGEK